MQNQRISKRKLTDGSTVYAVSFEAIHGDATLVTVRLECNSEAEAQHLMCALIDDVAYAETDAQ